MLVYPRAELIDIKSTKNPGERARKAADAPTSAACRGRCLKWVPQAPGAAPANRAARLCLPCRLAPARTSAPDRGRVCGPTKRRAVGLTHHPPAADALSPP